MSTCAVCVESSPGGSGLCPYHISVEDGWAAANRIMCDLVHRAIAPRRLPASERDQVTVITDDEGEVVVLAAN